MNIFRAITLKTLAKNKIRTLVTIIGIVLSAAMITAVTSSITSVQNYMYENAVVNSGEWHVSFNNISADTVEAMKQNKEITGLVTSNEIGYAMLSDSTNEDKPYAYVIAAEDSFFEKMPVHLISGRLPASSNEILVPKHLYTNGNVNLKSGQEITLDLGERIYKDETNLIEASEAGLGQNNPFIRGEELEVKKTQKYTVVGFYERPSFEDYSAPGYTFITKDDGKTVNPQKYTAYCMLQNPKEIYEHEIFSSKFAGILDSDTAVQTNSDVLLYSGVSGYDSFYNVLYSLGTILIILIMFGSVSLIYNAFSISVSERTKQFGLLSSIGATKKQIKKTVLFEALFVSVIGIPVGILAGIGGMGITFALIGDKFSSFFGEGKVSLFLKVSPWAIVIAAVVALLTVLISAWIPSKKAMRISAIEAIRMSSDIQMKNKKVKTSWLTYKLFGLEGMIARKHFKRNKKRYRATVVSLFMSIVLFISASSFSSYLTTAVTGVFEKKEYDISYQIDGQPDQEQLSAEELYKKLASVEGVTDSLYYKEYRSGVPVRVEDLKNPQFILNYFGGSEDEEVENVGINLNVYGIPDEKFAEYLKQNNLSKEDYMNPDKPLGIAVGKVNTFDLEQQKYIEQDLFKSATPVIHNRRFNQEKHEKLVDTEEFQKMSEEEQERLVEDTMYDTFLLPIGHLTDKLPFGLNVARWDGIYMVYPLSIYQEQFPDFQNNVKYVFKTTDHATVYDKMRVVLQDLQLPSTEPDLYDVYSVNETDRNMITIIKVFSYGFIALISLIALANVFNTISTNILLRRREFAMLKSVGMTTAGFNRMMNYECILYGMKSLLWGIPAAFIITYFIFKSVNSGYEIGFYLPWQAVVIAVLSVFIVVFATMLYAMRKIKKDNPIDALKNENL